jgi:hypothetical protein
MPRVKKNVVLEPGRTQDRSPENMGTAVLIVRQLGDEDEANTKLLVMAGAIMLVRAEMSRTNGAPRIEATVKTARREDVEVA